MCHTKKDKHAWLAVDYGKRFVVERVLFMNRATDCCWERTENAEFRISDELPTTADQLFSGGTNLGRYAAHGIQGGLVNMNPIPGQAPSGRYVIIQMNNGGEPLNLQEVQAFGKAT